MNLLNLFEFYLASMFVLSTARRISQYITVAAIVAKLPNRYPKLFNLVKQHRSILINWAMFWPTLLTLALWLVHSLLLRLVLPNASLTIADLHGRWIALTLLIVSGSAMIGLDVYFLYWVTAIDRPTVEKSLDQAEYWLTGWKAPLVEALTLGYVKPRETVNVEVKKALEGVGTSLTSSMWWTTLQMAIRVGFGAALWISWAVGA
jgi:uncharacterized protein with PQ loop repeat